MSKKIRLGYDILSKRAIETETGVNIDEALKRITSYKRVPGTGEDNRPNEPRPSTKVIYIVKVDGASQPDTYKEWIWNQPVDGVGNWECIGGTSDDANSWKRWSENRGSTGEGESVYLGVNDVANRDETYVLGKNNTTIVNDDTDYTNTDIVDVGSDNTATNAANAYQIGRENTVTGNNLANKDRYPHSMAMNLGRNNTITGEGVNIGKDNKSSTFGVTIGQRNQSSEASVAIGEDVDSYSGSISIGHGLPSGGLITLPMLSMTVDENEIPAQKVKLELSDYTYYAYASIFKTTSNRYEWGEIGGHATRVKLYENQELHTYIVGGNSASYSRVTGYFDANGSFIRSTDPSYDVKEYAHLSAINSVSVDFYCSIENNNLIGVSGFFRISDNQPEYGTILDATEYTTWLKKLSVRDMIYDNINVYTNDLSAPAMKCEYSGTNRPFYTKYSIYGYRDNNNNFIPYNDVTKYKSDNFIWETIPADQLHESWLKPEAVGFITPKTISRNDSIAIGKSMESDSSSFGVGLGTIYPQVSYNNKSDANGWIGFSDTDYQTLSIQQTDGQVIEGIWTTYYRVWFNRTVTDVSWQATSPKRQVIGNSIAILNTGSSTSYDNYLSGSSVGIGNGLKLTDNSFGFGVNIEGDNNSVLIGASLTSQVGGSTIVGRYISVKLGDSDNDGGTINSEYDGGLVAYGMSVSPAPGSVTIGSNGVTTGRGSLAVGLGGISATRGSVVYGRNSISAEGSSAVFGLDGTYAKGRSMALGLSSTVSAESSGLAIGLDGYVRATACSLAMGVREGSVIAHGNALAIGLGAYSTTGSYTTTVNATYRSASFGIGDVYASYNSMAVGKDGASATNGGMIFGKSSYIANQGMGFGTGLDASGGFAFGCGVAARSAGLTIGTTSIGSDTNASPYRIGDWVDMDGVNATLFAYLNPDGQYVPLQGSLYPSKGNITCCAYYKNIVHDGTTYPYAITESGSSTSNNPYWWDYNQQTWRYIGNSGNDDLYQTTVQQIYYGLLHNYVDNNGKTVYEVIDVPSYDKLNENSNIVLTYYAVQAQTFTKDGKTYVYGTGLGYDDNGTPLYELTNKNIPLNDTHVSKRNQKWAPAVLGYYSNDASEWQNRWKDDFSRMSTTSSVSIGGGAAHHTSFTFGQYAQGNLDYPNITNLIHSNGNGSFIPQRLEITKVYLADNQSIKICNGCNNTSDNTSILVGFYGNNARWRSMIIGQQNNFAGGTSFIAGIDNNVAVSRSIAFGSDNIASGQSMAAGYDSYAYEHGFSFGRLVRASNDGVALGINSQASAYSVLLGIYSQASKMSSTVGYSSKARDNSISIGNYCYSSNFGLAIGNSCTSAERTMAIGHNNIAFDAGIAIGSDCNAVEQAVAVGINNKMGGSNIAFGTNNSYVASSSGMAIGASNEIRSGGYNIVAGASNKAAYEAISLGRLNNASGWSIALGFNNTTPSDRGAHATMIGQFNTSTSNQEVIHKEVQIYVDGERPTQEQIDELTGRESAYRRLVDPYLDSEMIAYLNTADAGNNDYYLGRVDEMAWGYYSYFTWLQQLGNQPPFIYTEADKAALNEIMQQQPQTIEDYKNLMTQVCDIVQNYANVDELRSAITAASTINELQPIFRSELWQDIGRSLQWSGDPISGVVSDYDTLQQILDAYRSWNSYGLSLRSSLEPRYETIEEDVVCNSFLVGNNNTSNHYNSILIGSLNESRTPLVQPDQETHETDDDGFMVAIGYRNEVGRNYDVAIGYLSKAIGGENVALQHSEAEGYRNFAAFDSKVRGTANVLLGESTLLIPWDGGTSGDTINNLNAATHNLMFNSLSEHTTQPTGGYMQNVLLDVDLVTDTQSVTENFIYGGAGHENDTKVELTAGIAVTGNVILGSQHGSNPLKIHCTNAIIDNIISHPSWIVANASHAFHRNILIGQKYVSGSNDPAPIMNITGAETIIKNIVIHGSIIGKATTFINNIVLNDSQIESTYDQGDGGCVIHNILLNEAKLVNTDVETWWAGSYRQPCTDNIVIGANVSDSINSVIISDSDSGASISDALRIFNFGDNSVMHVAEGRVFGGFNTIQCAKKFFISGDQNLVASNAETMGAANGGNSFTTIFGSDNSVTSTPDEVCTFGNSRNTIFGCENAIRGSGVADNAVFGSKNQIGSFDTDYNITECFVSGSDNLISSRVNAFTILGKSNSVHCDGGPSGNKLWAIGNGFVQGNDNRVYFGSNTVAMGNGNIVVGHNSVAIGCQLRSMQWQTVIGKYNLPIDGPDRLTSADDPSQSDKALFIVGNGYSTKDDVDWKDEEFITRSNAMVVYANGDVNFSGAITAGNIPPAPAADGRYTLNCIVTNGVPSYSWVPVGTVTV